MRISTKILAAAAALVLAGAQPAPAAPHSSAGVVPALTVLTYAPATHAVAAAAQPTQDAKIDVNITSTEGKGAWYTQPIWIAIGVIALVVIILLAVVAGRRDSTTVVK